MAPALKPLVAGSLCRRLKLDEEALEFLLRETLVDEIRPASRTFTNKTGLSKFSSPQLIPTTRLPAGRTKLPDSPIDGVDPGTGWFLKDVGMQGTLGVGFHPTFRGAVAAADPVVEYVLQPAVRGWLYQGRKCHFRVHLLALSPAPADGSVDGARPRTRWFMHKEVWITAADAQFDSKMSADRASQISRVRTVELGATTHHAELWPLLFTFGKEFVASVVRPALDNYTENDEPATLRDQRITAAIAADDDSSMLVSVMLGDGDDAASRALRGLGAADEIIMQCAFKAREGSSSAFPKSKYVLR